ncbi:hypothetical protein BD769DRAFT_1386544 [Suillus cothurnatus]|nr:hypothetical protein BD769DRAFT_1386544 [Suillus cothurnatus]
MDPARICGSDLTSGTSDEKHKYMEYDRAHLCMITGPMVACRAPPKGYSYGTSSSSQGAHFSSTLSFETPSQGPSFEMPSQGSKMTLIQQGEVPQMDMMHTMAPAILPKTRADQ